MKKLLVGLTLIASMPSFASEAQDMNTYASLELKGEQAFFAPAERMEPLAEVYKKALNECEEIFTAEECSEGSIDTIRFSDNSLGIQVSVNKVYTTSGCSTMPDCGKSLESKAEIIKRVVNECKKFNTTEECEKGRLEVNSPAQRYNWKQHRVEHIQ